MKNILRKTCVVLFAGATMCAAAGLAACEQEVTLEGLSIVDAKTVFFIGDEFEYGESFKVYANYTDGTKTDVTDLVEIRKESGFDMTVSGDYQLTVIYENKREVYTIIVNDFETPLRKIELNTEKVKTQFELGETVSVEGLIITSTYENAQGGLITSTSSSLRGLNVEVADESGNSLKIGDVFVSLGAYTVTVSSGNVKASYPVSVEGINISTVRGALAVGNFFRSEVVSGTQKVREALTGGSFHNSHDYEYEFGENYTRVYEKLELNEVQHYGTDEEGIFCTSVQNGQVVVNSAPLKAEMMNGAPVYLWYFELSEFGIESALVNLYNEAMQCSNGDLKEQVNEKARLYEFSFSGLKFRSTDENYFETTVNFSLGEKYNIARVTVTQTFWENNASAEGIPGWELNFSTDENGITKPLARFTHKLEVTVNQTAGERTAENPYDRKMFKVQDYNLTYGGRVLQDGAIIPGSMDNNRLTIGIQDIAPTTADFRQDPMYMSLEGGVSEMDSSTFFLEGGLLASRSGNTISLQFEHGGVFTLILRTRYTRKTITFDIVGVPPTSMAAQIYNDSAELFAAESSKTVALNGSVYFYGAVDQYANPAQVATVTSDNGASATVQKTSINGIDCFRFSASTEGVYTVLVTSSADNSVSCTLTFTVSDVPDYAGILQGSYKVSDRQENIFALSFTPSTATSGKVSVTKTPTELDGTPIEAEAVTAVYSYTVDVDRLEITLTRDSGTELGIGLTVDATGALVLIDQYGDRYAMNAVD
ncbi:MAG: hypothetical protein K2L87_03790 [Clostridiales bacterium]|nr:hypothetical protein [Clostridiales bacterium]